MSKTCMTSHKKEIIFDFIKDDLFLSLGKH